MTMNIVLRHLAAASSTGFWVILIPLVAISILLFIIDKVACSKISNESLKIRALHALNSKTEFHRVATSFEIRKHYDNKSSYNRINPSYLMTADIRENIHFYADVARKIKENRERYDEYSEQARDIRGNVVTNLDDIKWSILRRLCRWCENRVFDKTLISPAMDCSFHVLMSYSSRRGKVYLSKERMYNFNDMYACLESVSRTGLDRETKRRLALVERGELSDSLRYDILRRDHFRCVICGASADDGARLHVDHIIPVSKGGKSEYDNLRTLCERCNIGKSDKIESDVERKVESRPQEQEKICPRCGGRLVVRSGSLGRFYGCSNYPNCKFTQNLSR